jgi:DNA-binding winged helix-turn-helix (wHTH) protein
VFEEVVAWVTEQSGLNIPADQLEFDIYDNSRGHPNCQGKIAYRGPVSPTSGGWPKIKLDMTADERLVLPSVRREVIHAYTDRPEGGIWANSYGYDEAFGEKLRALGERTRPRDLYDVVNLYRHTDSRPTAAVLIDVLRQKCAYKAIPVSVAHSSARDTSRASSACPQISSTAPVSRVAAPSSPSRRGFKLGPEAGTVARENHPARTTRAVRFGVCEVDLEAGELRKRGIKITLQKQPFQVLAMLVTHPGQLLTREELQRQIWVEDTPVDADLGLNTAIKKIRVALGDSADNPMFVETLPKRGYRFIAPVQEIVRESASVSMTVSESLPQPVRDAVETQDSTADSLEAASPNTSSAENGLPPETVVRHEYVAEVERSERPESEDKDRIPIKHEPDPGHLQTAMTQRAMQRKRYVYYGASILIPAVVVGFTVLQIQSKKLQLFSGHNLTRRGLFVYREANRANGSIARGIGGYDLRSPSDQAFAFDYDHSGKVDHLVLYRPGVGNISIVENSGGTFIRVFDSNGIGGFDLKSPHDRIFAFDYDHSGKLDHLVLYRPGTEMLWVLKNDGNGIFTPVYTHLDSNTPGRQAARDLLSVTDQIFAFDYDHSGKLDNLAIYRPGTGAISILKNSGGTFTPIPLNFAPGSELGIHDQQSIASQAFAFDYDHSGKMDHLVIYRPGTGNIVILNNTGGIFTPVYKGSGIGGYDLKSPNDRVFAFDYDHSGKLDNLLLYRPGTGLLAILKNANGIFTPVYEGSGVGGYDLKSWHDRAFAFDYDHSGKLDHLVLYRPGLGHVSITYFPRQQ